MLPDFTGVLAIRPKWADGDTHYRAYVSGRRLNSWDEMSRKDAESELATELERLAERDDDE